MRGLLLLLLLLGSTIAFISCSGGEPETVHSMGRTDGITIHHDDERAVTCFILYNEAISCLADAHLSGAISNEPLVSE